MLQFNLGSTDKPANIKSQTYSLIPNRQKLSKSILSFSVSLILAGSPHLLANDRLLPVGISPSSVQPAGVVPTGGRVVGGQGDISQLGRITNINQFSDLLAIDWDTFNLSSDGQVNFFQPGANSIALNRILDVNPSEIHGQINSNGIVVLLNPYGMLFGETSSINVGGLIASSFTINPDDFMNGDFTLSALDGVDASVVNFGVINAATGGSVNLLGGRVENHGLIAANLGSVNLASGREAVVTFDNEGLLGVKVTQSVLQDDIGVEPAVLNSGEISAAGGNILLSASASRDIFSQAVNIGDINEANGVIVHEDGSFTLGARGISEQAIGTGVSAASDLQPGGDIVNTGSLYVSVAEGDAGQIEILGENVTSSGEILANSEHGNGGTILLESNDTTLLTGDSVTSASSFVGGRGGNVIILGNWVGLLDESKIDAFGDFGGGEVLFGGDFQGSNSSIRNAQRSFVGEVTQINADALNSGDGGKVIIWADESTQYYGNVSAQGGDTIGNGGFVEVSGKEGLIFDGQVSTYASNGVFGSLLIDPKNITISTNSTDEGEPSNLDNFSDLEGITTNLNNVGLATFLASNSITLSANTDITFSADVIVDISTFNTNSNIGGMTLNAGRSIIIEDNVNISLNNGNFIARVNHEGAISTFRDAGTAVFQMGSGSSISTGGGDIDITTGSYNVSGATDIGSFTLQSLITTSTSGVGTSQRDDGGSINLINSEGDIVISDRVSSEGNSDLGRGGDGGVIDIEATLGTVTINGEISASGGDRAGGTSSQGGDAETVSITAGQNVNVNDSITASGGLANTGSQNGGSARPITINAGGNIVINADIESLGGANEGAGTAGNDREIIFNGDSSNNSFNINNGVSLRGASATINGLGGSDTVSASGAINNTWIIDAANTGTLENNGDSTDLDIRFNGISSLIGNAGDDLFSFTTNPLNAGVRIDGSSESTQDIVRLAAGLSGATLFAEDISNIESYVNLGNVNNILQGALVSNDWQITGTNSGTVNGVTFTDFSNIQGGTDGGSVTSDDVFTMVGSGSMVSIDGNGGTNQIIGRETASNTWTISAANTGTVNGSGFQDIQTLTGGNTVDDTFGFSTDPSLSGITIDGRGAATLDTIELLAGLGNVTLVAGSVAGVEEFLNSGNANNILQGALVSNDWQITGTNSGTVNGVTFTDFSNIQGGTDGGSVTSDDVFTMVGSGSMVSIDGNGGTNQIIGRETASNTWTISAANTGTVNGSGFQDIQTLTGGNTVDDTFGFSTDPSLSGITIDGRGAATLDTIELLAGLGNVTLVAGSVAGVEEFLNSGNANNILQGALVSNDWQITGTNSGTVNGVTFTDFSNIQGGTDGGSVTSDDVFSMVGSGSIASIDGNGGTNEIIGRETASNTWTISAANSGTVNGSGFQDIQTLTGGSSVTDTLTGIDQNNLWLINGTGQGTVEEDVGSPSDTINFSSMENIAGGSLNDIFNIAEGGSISGLLDGGTGTNTLQRSNTTGTNDWILTTANAGTLNGDSFTNIQTLTGSASVADTLTGRDQNNNWLINGANSGSVENAGATDTMFFSEMENINGGVGTGDDRFMFTDLGSISGVVNGGAHTSGDIIDYSQQTAVSVNLANAFSGISNTEIIQGNNTDSTLTGTNADNTWLITGENDGTVAGVTFVDFNNLVGGSLADIFNLAEGGSIAGLIDGGAGSNTLQRSNTTGTNTWILTTANAGTLNGGSFSNIQTLTGSANATDTLTGRDQNNDWLIDGTNSGSVQNTGATDTILFSEMENINGGVGTGDDRFAFTAAGSISGTIDAGDHTAGDIIDYSNLASVSLSVANALDQVANAEIVQGNNTDSTLTGADAANTWLITGENDGTVAGLTFVDFNNLVGGSLADIFNLEEGGSITGLIDGGLGSNTLQRSNTTGTNAWILTTANAGTLNGGSFSNIQTLTGSANAIDTLTGRDQDNTWLINGTNSGSVEDSGATDTIVFSEMENLNGGVGNGDDTFSFTTSGSVSGTIDAGNHTTGDIVDYSLMTTVNVTLANAANGVVNAETIQGNNTDSTLTGTNANNTWLITGENDGTVAGVTFVDFNNLVGGSLADIFNLAEGGSITGLIDGGAGSNTLQRSNTTGTNTWILTTANAGTLNGGSFSNIQTLTGSANATDTLTGRDQNNDWLIDGTNSGSVQNSGATDTILFSEMENINGGVGAGDDRFVFTAAGSISGTIDAGDHTNGDIIDYSNLASVSLTVANALDQVLNAEIVQGNNTDSTLTGADAANTWLITGENDGTVAGLTFVDFNNLVGGSLTDIFNLAEGGSITGLIDGGAGSNTLQRSNTTGTNTWILTTANAGTLNGGSFSNIQTLTGSANATDTLTGRDQDNTWLIDGANSGSVENAGATDTMLFSEMENINGGVGTGDDRFVFTAAGSISGTIDAGDHTAGDIIDYSNLASVSLNVATALDQVANAEIVQGNNTDSTLTGANVDNTWLISGENDGTVAGLTFVDFNNLVGGSLTDIFNLAEGGSITGLINGGAGTNTLQRSNTTGTNDWILTTANAGTLNGGSFSNIQTLTGSANATDTLTGRDQNNDWLIDGTNSGSVQNAGATDTMIFSEMENINGGVGAGDDRFVFTAAGSISGTIDAGDHTNGDIIDYSNLASVSLTVANALDQVLNAEIVQGNNTDSTLTGADAANTWLITGENDGTVAGLTFVDFNNLVGGSLTDIFNLAEGGSITGLIDGGAGSNTLQRSNTTGTNTWILTTANAGTLNGGSFSNIQTLTGSANATDTLTGRDQDNTWLIDGANSGSVENAGATDTIVFSEMENINGGVGTGDDRFVFTAAGSISGTIDAGDHTNGDIIDYSNLASVSLNVATALDQVANAEIVQGNNTDSTLTGANVDNTWLIGGENDGTVAGLTFVDFNNLVGGSLTDIFNLAEGGSITGLINGGAGTNTLQRSNTTGTNDWVLTTANAGTLNGGSFSNIQTLTGSANATDTLTGRDQDNTWVISGANSGSVVGSSDLIAFSEMENLNGGAGLGDDRFTFEEGSSISGVIDAGDHTIGDVVDYSLQTTVNVTLATAFNGVTNAEIIEGNNTDSTITGDNIINNWLITSSNSGSLGTLTFIGFNNIIGGNVEDTFTLGNGAEITGMIDGGLGANEIIRNNTTGTNQWTMSGEHQGSLNGNDFINIQSIVGSATVVDTLTGDNQDNDWLLDGNNSGHVSAAGATLSESTLFSNIDNLVGGDADDRFTITDTGSVSGSIDAGDHNLGDLIDFSLQTTVSVDLTVGINGILNAEVVQGNNTASTLYATNSNNTWYVDGENDGTLNSLTFIDFNNLVGGNLDDAFELTEGGTVTGQIIGGAGNNILQRSNTSGVNDWGLTAAHQGTLNGVVFTDFQTLIGSSTAIDTLTGLNQNNDWLINGANSGNVAESISGATDTLVFSNIENLNGGSSDDRFIITDSGSISGLIDAGDHVDGDIVDYSMQTVVNVSLANAFNGVSNAEIIQGNNTDSTLTGENTASTWLITGENDGLIGSLSFIDFNNLVGGSGDDVFEIQQGGSITGLINGAGGNNTLQRTNTSGTNIWELTAQFLGSLNGGAFSNIQNLVGSSQTMDTLIGINQDNDWLITGTDSGSVSLATTNPTDTVQFSGMENLTGGNGDDRFTITSTGMISGLIDGGGDILGDVIDYSSLVTVNLTLAEAFAGVSNVEIVQGNNTDSSLTGNNVTNNWVINGENDGTVAGITFIDFNNITGGSGVDIFTVEAGGAITGVINGGIGAGIIDVLDITALMSDSTVALDATTPADFNVLEIENIQANTDSSIVNSLLASDTVNTWNIDGINAGTLNTTSVSVEFAGFANLIGGELSDLFNLNSADHITGLIDGGIGGGDELNLLSLGRDITVQLGVTAGASSFDLLYANDIETINANTTQLNTLIGSNVASRWVIDGPNTSTIENINSTETVSFSGFSVLTGGTNDDSFEVIDTTLVSQINGGDGAGNDAIDYSNTTADVNIIIGSSLSPDGVEVTGIEGLIGNSSSSGSPFDSTITVNDGNNTWTIGDFDGAGIADGINDGLFQDSDGNVISFIDFNILEGGSEIDIFNVQNAGSITGFIHGGAGADELRLAVNGSGELRFIGGLGDDIVVLSGGGANFDASYSSDINSEGDEELTYTAENGTSYSLVYGEVETVQDDIVATNFTINGSSANDQIEISSGVVSVNGEVAVNFSNRTNLIFNGGTGDVFDLVGDLNLANGNLTVNNSSLTNSTDSLITADSLVFDSSANVGSDSARLRTNIASLSLSNVLGDLYIEEASDIELLAFSTTGVFDLVAGGDIMQSSASILTSNALVTLNSTNDIFLTNQNQLSGGINLSANASIVFHNSVSTEFAGINAQALELIINGDISDSGEIIVTGLTSIDANNNSVTFDHADNDFNLVTASNVSDLTLVDNGSLTLNQISVDNGLNVFGNDLTVSEAINAGSVLFDTSGLVSLSANVNSLNGDLSIIGNQINQNADLNSQLNISLVSNGQITMDANSSSVAVGNIGYSAEDNLNVSLLNTADGTVSLASQDGQIIDTNGDLDNIVANRAELVSQNGIGVLDAIETQLTTLHAQNGVGQININNRGTITLERLATIGDIEFNNTDLNGSDIYFVPGSVDAGYDDGALLMTTEGGSFLGVGGVPSFENADIVARAATFVDASFSGTFGSIARPLVLRVRDIATISVRTSFSPLFAAPLPEINDSASLFSFSSFDTISALAGGQLVEVESLVDVDPAIFTDLRNYNNDEIAVRLPNDQLFDYEEDEESEEQEESEELISVGAY